MPVRSHCNPSMHSTSKGQHSTSIEPGQHQYIISLAAAVRPNRWRVRSLYQRAASEAILSPECAISGLFARSPEPTFLKASSGRGKCNQTCNRND